jgi:hypothetical protein
MKDKSTVQKYTETLVQMTNDFCDQYVDQEYKELCEKLIRKMSRKREVPFLSGKLEIWAAAVVHALGSINFLFDKSFQPYTTIDNICQHFGTSKSTTGQKAKKIRDMFKMSYYDKEFSTARMKESNPFANIAYIDGIPISIKYLPPELQEIARENPDHPLTLWTLSENDTSE